MFQNVRSTVRAMSSNKQTPWESTSLSGDFYFNSGRRIADGKHPGTEADNNLRKERERLEREKRELEKLRAEVERQKLEAERKLLEAEKKKLETASLPQKSSYTRPSSSTSDVINHDGVYVAYTNGM